MNKRFVIFGWLAGAVGIAGMAGCGSSAATSGAAGHPGAAGGSGATGAGGTTGAGGATAGGACSPAVMVGTTVPGTMSWQDDGTQQCAYLIEGTHTLGDNMETVEIIGSSLSALGVGVTISVYNGTPIGGLYSCGSGDFPTPYVSLITTGRTVSGTSLDCVINVLQPGSATDNIIAMFSGTVVGDGGIETVTGGMVTSLIPPTAADP
jgi:hypothetical protein